MSLASLLMPEGEFRVIRCEIADKLIQCGGRKELRHISLRK